MSHYTGLRIFGLITVRIGQGRICDVERIIRPVFDFAGPSVGVMFALALAGLGRFDEARTVDFPPEPVTDHLDGVELDVRSRLAVLADDQAAAAAL
ncbi:hypothetical protein [Streptomyces brasiliscabiei]|uniref:hypothetical protein n=1 Tax=Streptomyces brasiliscabiei TaxID=2736302 RepID=UPI001C107647|nr:hypothetical protein [Streptomyces brasiliscabiei]